MAAQIMHGGESNKSNDANRMQRDTWRPIRQSRGALCLWALDQPACDPPSAYKWSDRHGSVGSRALLCRSKTWITSYKKCATLSSTYVQPPQPSPLFHNTNTPPPACFFSLSPSILTPPGAKAEYGAPKMKREHMLYVSVGALLKTDCCLFLCSMLHARWKKKDTTIHIIVHLFSLHF